MRKQRTHLLKAREAAEYLGVSLAALNRIDKKRELIPYRTPRGHRRYGLAMLDEYLERNRGNPSATTSPVE